MTFVERSRDRLGHDKLLRPVLVMRQPSGNSPLGAEDGKSSGHEENPRTKEPKNQGEMSNDEERMDRTG
jgi:hypothetical protein